jgi:hypothetical protein
MLRNTIFKKVIVKIDLLFLIYFRFLKLLCAPAVLENRHKHKILEVTINNTA